MFSARYFLKDSNSKEASQIYLLVQIPKQGKRKIYLDLKVHPSNWNQKEQKVKVPRKPSNNIANEIASQNAFLSRIKAFCNTLHLSHLASQKTLTIDEIALKIKQELSGENEALKSLYGAFELYIEQLNIKPKSRQGYTQLYNNLKQFEQSTKYKVSFDSITSIFYNKYQRFCYEVMEYEPNTFGKRIKDLKAFMNWAKRNRLTENDQHSHFKVINNKAAKPYLTQDEIDSIKSLNLTDNSMQEKARDLFLLCYYTAQRFSDLKHIKPENTRIVDGGKHIIIDQEKSTSIVEIPVHPYLESFWEKYDNTVPNLSNQKMNEALKEVAKKAGVIEAVNKVSYKGGEKADAVLYKYELVTTHIARRSWATNAYKSGMTPYMIMQVTGHKTEADLLRYLQLDAESNAIKLRESVMFQGS